MAEFTLLKLQFDEATFTANAPFSGSDEAETETENRTEPDEDDDAGPGLLPLVVGLVFLVVVAILVRKLRGGSTPEPVEPAAE